MPSFRGRTHSPALGDEGQGLHELLLCRPFAKEYRSTGFRKCAIVLPRKDGTGTLTTCIGLAELDDVPSLALAIVGTTLTLVSPRVVIGINIPYH